MKKFAIAFFLAIAVVVLTVSAQAALEVRGWGTIDGVSGQYQLIYDTELDITWLDYTTFTTYFYGNWYEMKAWADGLVVTFNGQTIDDWRLPSTDYSYVLICQCYGYLGPDLNGNYNYDFGYHMAIPEMGHLYYETLGNKGYLGPAGPPWPQPGWGLQNTGPFENLEPTTYWSGTDYPFYTVQPAWIFNYQEGKQMKNHKANLAFALAVRDGDVEPPHNTPIGYDVQVPVTDDVTGASATVTFSAVSQAGITTLTEVASGSGPPAPTSFRLGNPSTIFDIITDAVYDPPVTVCLDYTNIAFNKHESKLKLLQHTGTKWENITDYVNEIDDIICGTTNSLSFFAVVEPNDPPIAKVSVTPDLVAPIDSPSFTFDGSASYDPEGSLVTCDWDCGDGSPSVSGDVVPHLYAGIGLYDVVLTVTDYLGAQSSETVLVVVYDPTGGFVTGGGWIDSRAGAYAADLSLTGKATFGFVSKYKKGVSVPTGQTEFQFKAGDLNFHSDSYEGLVVTGGNYAKFKGSGTINGEGDYEFKLWAGDGEPDTFRIRIWTEDEATSIETDVYDNGFDQVIGGGSIKVHTK
jgi:hypothetical protein